MFPAAHAYASIRSMRPGDRAGHRGHEPRIDSVRKAGGQVPAACRWPACASAAGRRPVPAAVGGTPWISRTGKASVEPAQRVAAAYVPRNSECAYNNLKVMTRVVSAVYDEELRPVGLRASQLALLWAIRAMEPVEFGRLGATTFTDQTTLSRTVALLKRAGLVGVRVGDDRRVRVISLTGERPRALRGGDAAVGARPGPRGRVAVARRPAQRRAQGPQGGARAAAGVNAPLGPRARVAGKPPLLRPGRGVSSHCAGTASRACFRRRIRATVAAIHAYACMVPDAAGREAREGTDRYARTNSMDDGSIEPLEERGAPIRGRAPGHAMPDGFRAYLARIAVKSVSRIVIVPVARIVRLEAEDNYVRLWADRPYLHKETLTRLWAARPGGVPAGPSLARGEHPGGAGIAAAAARRVPDRALGRHRAHVGAQLPRRDPAHIRARVNCTGVAEPSRGPGEAVVREARSRLRRVEPRVRT